MIAQIQTISAVSAFGLGRFGSQRNPNGAHVTMRYRGRILLGEICGVFRSEVTNYWHLKVSYFNGEKWPIFPALTSVRVLIRTEK